MSRERPLRSCLMASMCDGARTQVLVLVLEPSAEVPRGVFHIVATAVAHGQVVVVGQHPTSRSARTLVGDKRPVSREARRDPWEPGTTPAGDPTAMDEVSARPEACWRLVRVG